MDTIQLREQEFHDQAYAKDVRRSLSKYYRVGKISRDSYLKEILDQCNDKSILEYGCGSDGGDSFTLARGGATVIGIDISPVAVTEAQSLSRQKALEDKTSFLVSDAENLDFPDGHFDMVVGSGILHHLDIQKSIREISRVLKPDGKAVFLEPLAHNPVIRLYRLLTPSLRTQDEHPLARNDLAYIRQSFTEVHLSFFSMLSLFNCLFSSYSFFEKSLSIFNAIDRFLFRYVPFTRFMAWQVLIVASKNPITSREEQAE